MLDHKQNRRVRNNSIETSYKNNSIDENREGSHNDKVLEIPKTKLGHTNA